MTKYFKILNQEEKHHDYQYQTGLNINSEPFNPSGDCEAGGFYITTIEHVVCFLGYGCSIAEVELPENTKIYKNPGTPKKWKVDQLILLDRIPLTNSKNLELISYCKNLTGANLYGANLYGATIDDGEDNLYILK